MADVIVEEMPDSFSMALRIPLIAATDSCATDV
jgi:hypothetical protein